MVNEYDADTVYNRYKTILTQIVFQYKLTATWFKSCPYVSLWKLFYHLKSIALILFRVCFTVVKALNENIFHINLVICPVFSPS